MTNQNASRVAIDEAEALVRRLAEAGTLPSSDELRPLATSLLQFIEPLHYGRPLLAQAAQRERLQVIELELINASASATLRPFIDASALRTQVQALLAGDGEARVFAHYVEALLTWQRVYEAKEAEDVR